MITIYDNDTGASLGTLTEAQLRFLIDQLEEESSEDRDYYINQPTLALFEARGADPALIDLLRTGLAGREDMEIRWAAG